MNQSLAKNTGSQNLICIYLWQMRISNDGDVNDNFFVVSVIHLDFVNYAEGV